ncbi:hypothetical protein BV20DRAFT_144836 [Pilatotrama ljubarskyi]|nr:hypothetical protein BV20DRAFT_144836 [Pilatotrama ljubarskyi]
MKSILVLAALALSALAQQAQIVSPAPGSTITAGSEVTIEVHQDEAATDDVQVAVILGIRGCPSGDCTGFDPADFGMGTLIYHGVFDPQRDPTQPQKGLFQDFTFQVPDFLSGSTLLSLAHLQAVGAVKIPTFNVSSIVVNVD